jgi:phage tail-like protein
MGVVIDGVAVTRVRSISRSRLTVTVERSVSSSGTVSFGRGISNAPVVSLTREADGDRTFRTWFAGQKVNGSTSSNALPKEVVMTLYGRRGSVISRLTLTNAWPSQWHGATWSLPLGASNILTESVTLVADSATFD